MTAASLDAVRAAIRPGVTTLELDAIAESAIRDARRRAELHEGARLPPHDLRLGERRCRARDSRRRVLEPGDIVSIDSGAEFGGWNGDAAFSVVVPDPARPELVAERQKLVGCDGAVALARASPRWPGHRT